MAGVFELLGDSPTSDAPAPQPGAGDTFGQGLRVGGLSARGQLSTLAGKAMQATGFDGAGLLAAGAEDQRAAQAAGQGLTPIGDVRDLSSGLRWASGAIGASAPMAALATGASLLGGRGAAGRMLAGTAAMTPFEMGEGLQRMDADPVAAQLPAAQQLRQSFAPAAGAALAQNIVPAGVAARLGGHGVSTTGRQILARGLADIPAEGLAEGAGEGIRQFGLNRVNPNAGYDLGAIGQSALEGAALGGVFGGVGAAGEAAHHYAGAAKALPGRAIDAARGLIPERAQKRAGEALDAAGEAVSSGAEGLADTVGRAAEWAKGPISQRVADVKAWGREFMADEAAPDSFKAQVQDALANPGDKARQMWLATQKFARDAAGQAKAAVDEADIPTRLREFGEKAKTSVASLRDRIAAGQETADPAELDAATSPDEMAGVFARADQTATERAKQWGSELLDSGLGPEKAEQVKQWLATAGDRASQQGIAALHQAQEKTKAMGDAVSRFAGRVKARADELEAGGVKKSEVSTEASKALGSAITGVLGADHPALSDPKLRTQLADGLRSYINDVASGKALSSFDKLDQLEALYDVAGDQTTALLNAVHSAVRGAGQADQEVFKTLNQMDAIAKGRQGVVETLQKNLRPELQRTSVRSELKAEAEMLTQWARSQSDDPAQAERSKFNDNQVRAALQLRYGDKADLVMKAVQKSVKAEANMIAEQAGDADEAVGEDPTDPTGRVVEAEDEISKSRYYAQKGQLYLSPEKDKGKAGFEGAAAQRLKKAQKDNPNAVVRFVKASELGLDHPMVRAKYEDLLDAAETLGLDPDEAKAYADKRIDDFGVVVAEQSKQETAITDNELDKVRLDAKKYGQSKSRIDAGEGVILDAARLTEFMQGKLKGDFSQGDDAGRPFRTARMFMEGVAAVQARIGRSFDIPDSTVIAKNGMTWGEARKLDARTTADKADDARTQELVRMREAYKRASPEEREAMKAEAEEITSHKEERKAKEQTAEMPPPDMTAGPMEKDPFGPTFEALGGRGEFEADEEGNLTVVDEGDKDAVIHTNADGSARGDTVMGRRKPATSENAAQKEQRESALEDARNQDYRYERKKRENTPKPKTEDRQAAWVAKALSENLQKFKAAADKLNRTQIDALATFMGDMKAPPAGVPVNRFAQARAYVQDRSYNQEAPPDPKVVAAKKAAFLEKARSGDPALLTELRNSDDVKGLQRAAAALAEQGDSRALDAAYARLRELVQIPDVAYGLQTKKYSLQSEAIHAALGRPGFAATHDSPIKHAGIFDWRTHALKGEGAMVKGAGTYLSTSDAVHGYYKKAMTQRVSQKQFTADDHYRGMQQRYAELKTQFQNLGRENYAGRDMLRAKMLKLNTEMENYRYKQRELSPTYHLSVDIAPEQLLDWDKPFAQQSELVRDALKKEGFNEDAEPAEWDRDGETTWTLATEGGREAVIELQDGVYKLYSNGDYQGEYMSLKEAKGAGQALLGAGVNGEDIYKTLSQRLGGDAKASDYLQSLGILGHRMKAAAKDGVQNPNYVIYDDSKIHTNYVHFDQTKVAPGSAGPVDRQAVLDYIGRVHGNSVALAWKDILHAGEFERTALGDVIRLSVHSLNPMSTAYHEALHGLFAKLNDAKHADIRDVLEKAGSSAPVQNQLKKLLANEPAALAQLSDPEERAAYMYQFWAQGKLTVGPKVKTLFQRIAAFIRQVTGLLTNDERAVKILEAFHSGEYEKMRSDPNAVHRALMSSGAKGVLDKAAKMTQPLRELGETLASAGGARLRDTGIPALRELADAMKLKTTSEGDDPGFLPAARLERSRLMNQLGVDLKPYSEADIREATEAMQAGRSATGTQAKIVAKIVNRRLAEMLDYMQKAGVRINDLGLRQKDGVPYFPRSWDASYISAHQTEFLQMLEKYASSGALKGDPRKLMQTLMVTDGNEFNVEVDKPGMQHAKQRALYFISHADAAPFMRKDLYQILNSYTTQATRRAEWARRFGDDGQGVRDLLDRAAVQGATPAQLKAAQQFVRAVDGTLGDTINPALRRLQGNVMVYENIRLLPLAIFSSLVDPAGIAVRGGTVGDAFSAFKRGIKETVKNFQAEPKGDAMTELAEAIGTVDNAALVHAMGASYSQGMVGDTGRKINDTFFRLNLMEQFNNSMRVAATESALKFIARHAARPNEHSERYLKELGLTAADVQQFNGRAAVLESEGLTLEQSAKMKAAVNRWVDGAVLRPDAVDKPVWMSDPHFALMAHLKQFVFSFHETILKRVVHEAKAGNYTPAMALASYVPMMIAADYLKGIIQGGGQQPPWKDGWTAGDYVWSGMERAGLFGVGQFGLDMLQDAQRGGTGIGALSGPAIEQLVDALQVMGGREQFGAFALKSLPANALYSGVVRGEAAETDLVN